MSSPSIVLRPELKRFLGSYAPGSRVLEMPGDASTRRFWRVVDAKGASLVVMDYGVPFEDATDDVRIARIFEDAGLPVARIVAIAAEAGALLLEDLGDRTFEVVLAELRAAGDTRAARDLYRKAVDLAAAIATRGTEALRSSPRSEGPSLDAKRFRFEMDFFVEHYLGHLLGVDAPPGLREQLHALADLTASGRTVLCHRDYHSRNLMVRADDNLAMVDIQDARWGPDGYDLASLLRDAYVDDPDPWVDELVDAYFEHAIDGDDPGEFRRRFDLLSVERMIKALGTFGYQATVAGRRRYLSAVPRTLARLEQLIPALTETAPLDRPLRAIGFFNPVSMGGE